MSSFHLPKIRDTDVSSLTKDNVADAMTKPLGKVLFLKHREALVKGD